ncbi:haloacid dehalogenase-like hydrolase superfamily protein [Dorcoceras hygrometricum]|uniref:Haloacid dehalogenase-like hydrolase superfamily protein n=1 Tax=Dorcoceras hygrometricum TaxID=472368 RepID=A0A2Z7CTE8_9LAMI|nr:haloacid dehalogenase-like hydrolase superfamily protein [Dorcoceras hygrometricum]
MAVSGTTHGCVLGASLVRLFHVARPPMCNHGSDRGWFERDRLDLGVVQPVGSVHGRSEQVVHKGESGGVTCMGGMRLVKETTSCEGNQLENKLRVQQCSRAVVNKSITRAVQLKKQPTQGKEQTSLDQSRDKLVKVKPAERVVKKSSEFKIRNGQTTSKEI